MQEFLNENTLFATLAMFSPDSQHMVLVVEGDDDHLTLKSHCSEDLILIPGIGGKPQVLKAAALAQQEGLRRVRFLVDSDYDMFLDDLQRELDNVLYSETHDCFTDIIYGNELILPRLVEVHAASARRRPESESVPTCEMLCDEAITLATKLAAVRIVDARESLCLNFKGFSFYELNVSDPDLQTIAQKILTRSTLKLDEPQEFFDEVERTYAEIANHEKKPFGDHDLLAAVARTLKRHQITVSDRELRRGLILSVSCDAILRTRWFHEIQDWCAASLQTGFSCTTNFGMAA